MIDFTNEKPHPTPLDTAKDLLIPIEIPPPVTNVEIPAPNREGHTAADGGIADHVVKAASEAVEGDAHQNLAKRGALDSIIKPQFGNDVSEFHTTNDQGTMSEALIMDLSTKVAERSKNWVNGNQPIRNIARLYSLKAFRNSPAQTQSNEHELPDGVALSSIDDSARTGEPGEKSVDPVTEIMAIETPVGKAEPGEADDTTGVVMTETSKILRGHLQNSQAPVGINPDSGQVHPDPHITNLTDSIPPETILPQADPGNLKIVEETPSTPMPQATNWNGESPLNMPTSFVEYKESKSSKDNGGGEGSQTAEGQDDKARAPSMEIKPASSIWSTVTSLVSGFGRPGGVEQDSTKKAA